MAKLITAQIVDNDSNKFQKDLPFCMEWASWPSGSKVPTETVVIFILHFEMVKFLKICILFNC